MKKTIQPYLGPRAHLSLSWLSHPLLALLLVGISLVLLLNSINDLVSDAKDGMQASCRGVESAANVMVSLPHYMADGVNEMNVRAVQAIVDGAAEVLDLGLVGIEAIAIFIVDMYRSLFLCLMNLAIHGSLDLLIAGTKEAQLFVTTAFAGARLDIQRAVAGINAGLANSVRTIERIPGVDIDTPQIDLPSLDSLRNVTIPSSVLQSLIALNSSIPTLDSLRASLNQVISAPIERLRTEVRSSLANSTINIALLPSPAKQNVQFCAQELDLGFIDEIGALLFKFVKIGLVLLAAAIALIIIIGGLWENYRYKAYLRGIDQAREAWLLDRGDSIAGGELSKEDLRAFLEASQHPTFSLLLAKISRNWSQGRKTTSRWFGSYILHPSALAFLIIGIVGLIVIEIELRLLEGPVRDQIQQQSSRGLGGFSAKVVGAVNGNMNATSIKYASDSNAVVMGLQRNINDDLFGWVDTTTTAMNTTIVSFYDGLASVVSSTFRNTPFDKMSLELIDCLIGSKVTAISKALTFIHNNSRIDLPLVSPTVLLLSPARTTELVSSISGNGTSTAGNPTGADAILGRMIDRYAQTLKTQRLGFIICIGMWIIVLLFGIIGVLTSRVDDGKDKGATDEFKSPSPPPPSSAAPISSVNNIRLKTFHLPTANFKRPAMNISSPIQFSAPVIKLKYSLPSYRKSPPLASPIEMTQSTSSKFPTLPPIPAMRAPKFNISRPRIERDSETMGLVGDKFSTRSYPALPNAKDSEAGSGKFRLGSKVQKLIGKERHASITTFGDSDEDVLEEEDEQEEEQFDPSNFDHYDLNLYSMTPQHQQGAEEWVARRSEEIVDPFR